MAKHEEWKRKMGYQNEEEKKLQFQKDLDKHEQWKKKMGYEDLQLLQKLFSLRKVVKTKK